jgi:hypothetical protein
MFMADPYQVLVAFTIAFVTFLVVRYGLMNVLILFGRRKFSAMLLTSSMLSWTLLWAGPTFLSARVTNHLDLASMALTPLFVPGLLANDMDRTSPLRVVAGCGLAAAFVVPTTWWIQSIVEGSTLELQWIVLALSTFVIIFWKSARQLYRHYRPVAEAGRRDRGGRRPRRRRAGSACRRGARVAPPRRDRARSGADLRGGVRARVRGRAPPWPWLCRPATSLHHRRPKNCSHGRTSSVARRTGHEQPPRCDRAGQGARRPVGDRLGRVRANVYSIDSDRMERQGQQALQDAHPDAWEAADRWLRRSPHSMDARHSGR